MSSSLKEERKEEKIATSTAWNNMEQEAKQQEKEAEMKNSEVHFPPSYNQLFFTDVSSSIVASSVSSTSTEEQCQQQVDVDRCRLSQPVSATNLVVLDVASTGSDPSINYVEMMLKDKYPVRYAVFHACILILSSVSAILLQIELIAQNGALNEVAAGIWCGVLGLLTSLIIFLNVKYRNYSLYNVSTLLNAVVAFVYLFGLVVINAIAMDSYSECSTLQICYNNAMFPLNVVFIGLGVFTFIHCFVFAVAVNCLIRKRSCHRCHTVCSSCFPSA